MTISMTMGQTGEDLAAAFLSHRGWRLLARNWRSGHGEVDIVAVDPGGALVLVEVKTRLGTGYGTPLEAITHAKVAKLREMAGRWFAEQGSHGGQVRIDAIGITLAGGTATLQHVRAVGR